ncbi:MAG: hypothetical protein R2911_44135 [Caldilineaceae bacterium]
MTPWPVALDDDDNDPSRFFVYLIGALQTIQPTLGASAQELFTASQSPSFKASLTLLLNDLASLSSPVMLVLDDYHLITTPAIHEAITFLVDHLPQTCHLVVTTRIDPPCPWRAGSAQPDDRNPH